MEAKLRCLIVDDEALARKGLQEYVEDIDFLELAGMAEDVEEASELLNAFRVDVMFLDVKMPGMSGIDFLRSAQILPKVILTTAYSEYAVEAYELDVVDYLVKPISFNRFYKSCKKAKEILSAEKSIEPKAEGSFFIKSNKKYEVVQINDILFVEALQNYVILHTLQKKTIAYMSLKEIYEKLPPSLFVQVHKSFLVGVNHIDTVTREEIIIKGNALPVGRSYSDFLFREIVAAKLLRK